MSQNTERTETTASCCPASIATELVPADETGPLLIPISNIVSAALSNAAVKKVKQAKKLLLAEARIHRLPDPVQVTEQTSQLIINVLYKYSKLGTVTEGTCKDQVNGRDAVAGIITGLRWVYREAGHVDSWQTRIGADGKQYAHGNPLENNNALKAFRNMHSQKLSEFGRVVRTAPPLRDEHIIEHGVRFLVSVPTVNKRDLISNIDASCFFTNCYELRHAI